MMVNALAWRRLYRDSRHLRLGLCLGLAVAFLPMMASAQTCRKNYIIENRTTIAIEQFFYMQNGQWTAAPPGHVITSGTRHQLTLVGRGESLFQAVFAGRRITVYGRIPNICTGSGIVICQGDPSTGECRDDGSDYIMVAG
jgi:hypothetical protein